MTLKRFRCAVNAFWQWSCAKSLYCVLAAWWCWCSLAVISVRLRKKSAQWLCISAVVAVWCLCDVPQSDGSALTDTTARHWECQDMAALFRHEHSQMLNVFSWMLFCTEWPLFYVQMLKREDTHGGLCFLDCLCFLNASELCGGGFSSTMYCSQTV